jgi:hypothetical protein
VAVGEKRPEDVCTQHSAVFDPPKDVGLKRVLDERSTQRLRRSLDLFRLD